MNVSSAANAELQQFPNRMTALSTWVRHGQTFPLTGGPIKYLYMGVPADADSLLDAYRPFDTGSIVWKKMVTAKGKEHIPTDHELSKIFRNCFQTWMPYESLVKRAVNDINHQLQKRGVQLGEFTFNLYLTDGSQRGKAGHYTMGDNVILISDAGGMYKLWLVWAAQFIKKEAYQMVIEHTTHELFHVWSRSHPQAQKELYEKLGFVPCNTELPQKLARRLYNNPDIPYTVRKEIEPDLWAMPLQLINEDICTFDGNFKRKPGKPPLQDFLETSWVVVEQDAATQKWTCAANSAGAFLTVKPPKDIVDKYNYAVHPEEMLAELFIHWVWQEDLPRKEETEQRKKAAEEFYPYFEECFKQP